MDKLPASKMASRKSSYDYSQLFGLKICFNELKMKKTKTKTEEIVFEWLQHKIEYLEKK